MDFSVFFISRLLFDTTVKFVHFVKIINSPRLNQLRKLVRKTKMVSF